MPWIRRRTDLLPLCVDLDGTLIRSDLLYESAAALLRQKPWLLFAMPIWLAKGRANLKRQISTRVAFEPALLPYHQSFLEWLGEEQARGRLLILATASDELLANAVAGHLAIFDSVVASNGKENRKGKSKLAALSARYGRQFAYAGNSGADLEVWRGCEEGILVSASPATAQAARALGNVTREFPAPPLSYATIRHVLRARLCQWILTLSIAPTIMMHNPLWAAAALAICCLLSGLFVTRDVLNIQQHRTSVFPLAIAFFLGPALLLAGLLGTLYISRAVSR